MCTQTPLSLSKLRAEGLPELIESVKVSVNANLHSGTQQASKTEEIKLNTLVH